MVKARAQAPVVAVINMKGGVGKTTIAANVFREVFRRKTVRTLLVDFDAQFNLSQLLLTRAAYEELRKSKRTIYHVMEPEPADSAFAVAETDLLDVGDVDAYTHRMKYISMPEVELRLLPGDFRLAMLNLHESPGSLRIPRHRFRSYIAKAREAYGLVVLDCNPSSSFVTRCAIEAATHLVVPVRPDRYSLLGVEMIKNYLDHIPTLVMLPQMKVLLNSIGQSSEGATIEAELRAHPTFGPMVLVNAVVHSGILAARSDHAGFAVDRKAPYHRETTKMLARVADELASELGLGS